MAKFTMVEHAKAEEAINKMMEAAVKALDIKDLEALKVEETAKIATATDKAGVDFTAENEKKDPKEKLVDEKLAEAVAAAQATAKANTLKEINPLVSFSIRLADARVTLAGKADAKTGEVKEEDFNAFKKELHAAHFDCVQSYKKEGNKSAVEYMKAAGLALVGALVAIVASPVLAFSADRRQQLVETFFSGVHSDASRKAQAELKDDVTPFVTTAAPGA